MRNNWVRGEEDLRKSSVGIERHMASWRKRGILSGFFWDPIVI